MRVLIAAALVVAADAFARSPIRPTPQQTEGSKLEASRQEFLLLRGVASQVGILRSNIGAHPQASALVVGRIFPQIKAIFDANKDGKLETSDLKAVYPLIADYHKQHIAGKFVRLPIVSSAEEFASGIDLNKDGAVSQGEVLVLVVGDVGTPLWNTAILHFVESFDREASQKGYLSPAETRALAQTIMAALSRGGEKKEASLAEPAPIQPTKAVISVPNKMELLRKRFADPANLPFASQLIKANAAAIYDTADLDGDKEVSEAELEDVWELTKEYLESTLGRSGRMVPLAEWKTTLGLKPNGQVQLTTDELVDIMTKDLTGKMWESFQACVFNLAIDGDQDGQLTAAELAEFQQSPFYALFQLPLHLKYQS